MLLCLGTVPVNVCGSVDLVAGPDAYRDLPKLISIVKVRGASKIVCVCVHQTPPCIGGGARVVHTCVLVSVVWLSAKLRQGGDMASNVQLSQDETYADLAPVRLAENSVTAHVSIMRGCNNMCAGHSRGPGGWVAG